MALNINTTRLNDAIQRMLSFMMQNELSELSNERYFDRSMGIMSEQDRLMRERAAEEDVRTRGLKEYESKINVDEYIKKAFIDTAKSSDAYDYNVRAGNVAKEAGDLAKSKQYFSVAYQLAIPNLRAKMNALKGRVDEQDFLAAMEAFGEDGVEKLMTEAGTNARFGAELPTKKLQAETSKGNLDLARAKEARTTTGEMTQDDYYKVWHTKINGIQRTLLGIKDALGDPTLTEFEKQSFRDLIMGSGIKPQEILPKLGEMNALDTKAMRTRLTPGEEAYLDNYGKFVEGNILGAGPSAVGSTATTGVSSVAPPVRYEQAPIGVPASSLPPGTLIGVNRDTQERVALINGVWVKVI